jgi:hypothetical protein
LEKRNAGDVGSKTTWQLRRKKWRITVVFSFCPHKVDESSFYISPY